MSERSVKTWRDEVSFQLGQISAKIEQVHVAVKRTNGKVVRNDERLCALEQRQCRKKAVSKLLVGIWAVVGGTVVVALQKLVPVIFSLFK